MQKREWKWQECSTLNRQDGSSQWRGTSVSVSVRSAKGESECGCSYVAQFGAGMISTEKRSSRQCKVLEDLKTRKKMRKNSDCRKEIITYMKL